MSIPILINFTFKSVRSFQMSLQQSVNAIGVDNDQDDAARDVLFSPPRECIQSNRANLTVHVPVQADVEEVTRLFCTANKVQEEMCDSIVAALKQSINGTCQQPQDVPIEVVHNLNQEVDFDGVSHYIHLEPEQDPEQSAKVFCKKENVSKSDCALVSYLKFF
jgi:hypothetical protein